MVQISRSTALFLKRRNQINKITCRGLAIAIALLAVGVSLGYLSRPPERGIESRHYSECRDDKAGVESCLTVKPLKGHKQIAKDGQASSSSTAYEPNEFIKDKRDINAQEGMWRATNLVAFYALFQTIFGGISLLLIFFTLRATRDALVHTRDTLNSTNKALVQSRNATEIARKESLPYVFVQIRTEFVDEAGKFSELPTNFANTKISVKNFGKSPATDVTCDVEVDAADSTTHDHFRIYGGRTPERYILGADKNIEVLSSDLPIFDPWVYHDEEPCERHYLIACTFSYSDATETPIIVDKVSWFDVSPIFREVDIERGEEVIGFSVKSISVEDYRKYQKSNIAARKFIMRDD